MHHHQCFREEAQERIKTRISKTTFFGPVYNIESFRISFMIPNKVPANMGCSPIGQPIGVNRSRSQPMSSREYHGSWERPNQALNVWDQFYNAAGPSDPRNSLEILSHQVRILIK